MRIGTRGSVLALSQARWVAARIDRDTQVTPITTTGDRGEAPGDKSRWVSALERALLHEQIDIAVHSAKDVPAELADGLELVAIPSREDPRDAICGAPSLDALPTGARVGTSSLRRAAQIAAMRPDLEVVELRGNVDTRLRKLEAGEADALVLAMAGLARLGRGAAAGGVLDALVPAAGQGALAIEGRMGEIEPGVLSALRDVEATACVTAERALTRALEASCQTAVGAHATVADGDQLRLRAWVGRADGSAWLSDELTAGADTVGELVAQRMLAAGAHELLRGAA